MIIMLIIAEICNLSGIVTSIIKNNSQATIWAFAATVWCASAIAWYIAWREK